MTEYSGRRRMKKTQKRKQKGGDPGVGNIEEWLKAEFDATSEETELPEDALSEDGLTLIKRYANKLKEGTITLESLKREASALCACPDFPDKQTEWDDQIQGIGELYADDIKKVLLVEFIVDTKHPSEKREPRQSGWSWSYTKSFLRPRKQAASRVMRTKKPKRKKRTKKPKKPKKIKKTKGKKKTKGTKKKGKKKMNAYMLALKKARKSNAESFVYKGKTYYQKFAKTGMAIYSSKK